MGGAAVSCPRGPGSDSHLTGFTSHASKPMEHGLSGDLIRGSSYGVRPNTSVMRSGAISLEAVDTRL